MMNLMTGFMSVVLTIVVAILVLPILLALFVVLYLFVAAPVQIAGNSMHPNYQNGQYWVTNKLTYRERNPERYDVVIYNMPGNENKQLIGRVIALPDETAQISDNTVYINQAKEDGSYLPNGAFTAPGTATPDGEFLKVLKDHYFILGDNSQYSQDSRSFGMIPKKNIVSKTWFCYWKCF